MISRNGLWPTLVLTVILASGCGGGGGSSVAPAPTASPTQSGAFLGEFTIGSANPNEGDLQSITQGPDGNMWVTEYFSNAIARVSPHGTVTLFPLQAGSGPGTIVSGPDGNLWFTEASNHIGRISTSGAEVEYPLSATPAGITIGVDGNVYFTAGSNIGRFNPTVPGNITYFPAIANPGAITSGPDGNLWYLTTNGYASAFWVARMSLSGAQAGPWTPFCFGGTCSPRGLSAITAGPDGNVWMGSPTTAWRVAPDGTLTSIPAAGTGVALGADGNLWFGSWVSPTQTLTRVTPAMQPTTFNYGNGVSSGPLAVSAGPNRTIWFTENVGNHVGVVQL